MSALVLAAGLALAVAAGCSREGTLPNVPSTAVQRAPTTRAIALNAKHLAHARSVKASYWARMKGEPGVFGMGISWDENGTVFIGVTVEKGTPGAAARVGREIEGVPIRVIQSQRPDFFAMRAPPPPPNPLITMGTSAWPDDPEACSGGSYNTGTVGCVVRAGGNTKYFLSCAHVFAPNNSPNLTITDPARRPPGCLATTIIGTTTDFTPLVFGQSHTMDAAIVKSLKGLNYTTAMSSGYTPTTTVTEATVGLAVKKTGAASGLRTATVTMIHYDFVNIGNWDFTDQIYIEDNLFARPGDSGSLVVTETQNDPVGIVIGGIDGMYTIATPIQRILDRFGVTMAP